MKNKVGVQSRQDEQDRRIKRVKKLAIRILTKEFPNPDNKPSNQLFLDKWATITRSLERSFGSFRDYRIAFNNIVRTIEGYRKEYQWNISAPTYIFTQKAERQVRNQGWLKQAWAFQYSYQSWFENITDPLSMNTTEQCYQALMLSFMCHSGHSNIPLVSAFSSSLIDPIEVKICAGRPFITLQIDVSGFNTNINADGEAITQYICYLSPITQGLIRRWIKLDLTYWKPPQDNQQIYHAIITHLDNSSATFPITLKQLTSVSISIAEQLPLVEIDQALVEYAISNTKSYSLHLDNLARVEQQQVTTCSITQFYDFKSRLNNISTGIDNTQKIPSSELYSLLANAVKRDNPKKKLTPERLRMRLTTIIDTKLPLNQKILVDWLLAKSHTCKASTIATYHSALTRRWLYATENIDLTSMESDDFECLYHSLIDPAKSKRTKVYLAARLTQLHGFAVTRYELPALLNALKQGSEHKPHTRSGFIDEALFSALLLQVYRQSDLNNEEKNTLNTLLIIAYRCGLRIGELRKLRLCDIEYSSTGWIEVRNNIYNDNKTAAALRKVPLFSMLLVNEAKTVREYIKLKQSIASANNNLLFTLGQDRHKPIDEFLLSNFTAHVLRELSGLPFLVFHHLRHSCLSRLQVMLEIDDAHAILPNVVPYSRQETAKICHQISGNSRRNRYYAISTFAGHSSPETCFNNYFHFTDWIIGYKLAKTCLPLPKTVAMVLGLCSRQAYTTLQSQNSTLYPNDFQPYLNQKLKPSLLKNIIQQKPTISVVEPSTQSEKHDLNLCYIVLEHIQNGFDIREIAFKFRIEQDIIDKWLTNAKYIKTFHTAVFHNHKRHFSEARLNKLVPGQLKSSLELKLINTFVIKLKSNYQENRVEINWAVLYGLNHSNMHQSGIYFAEPEALSRFISTFQFAIPKSYWRVVTDTIEQSPIKSEWEESCAGIRSIKGKKASKRGRVGRGAIRLELRHPNEKDIRQKGKYKKFSSHALIYLFHMMGIMMFNVKTENA